MAELKKFLDFTGLSQYDTNIKGFISDVTGNRSDLSTNSKSSLVSAINETNSIAKGATVALSLNSYSDLVSTFSSLGKDTYKLGQTVFIKTLNVPDVWVSGISNTSSEYNYTTDAQVILDLNSDTFKVGFYSFSKMETQKVDLSNYATKVPNPITGHLVGINPSGDLIDSGIVAIDITNKTIDLTWSELVALRNGGSLIADQSYRIKDFVTTVGSSADENKQDIRSAGHPFDIIVTALNNTTLSEDAKAVRHNGDTYFSSSDLSSWKLKYSLNNDLNRFEWADAGGKGVIYQMEDEWGNMAPYDFKNIQFKIYKTTDECSGRTGINGKYAMTVDTTAPKIFVLDYTDFIWCYTFSSDPTGNTEQIDYSLSGKHSFNKINCLQNVSGKRYLYKNVFFGGNVTFCTLMNFANNVILGNFYGIIGAQIRSCVIANDNFGYNNILRLTNCSFGNGENEFNTYIDSSDCSFNDGNLYQNYFGARFYNNELPGEIRRCHFGENIRYLKLNVGFFYDNILENGIEYLTISSEQTTSATRVLRYLKFDQGLGGTDESTRKTIFHNTVNDTIQTEYKSINSKLTLI